MPPFVSTSSYDYISPMIVPVIASFNTKGQVKPLYVRIDGEEYKVISSRVRRTWSNTSEFFVEILVGNTLRPVTLTYYEHENVWGVPREE